MEFFTAYISKKIGLFLCFYPFSQGMDTQFFGHADDGRQDNAAFLGKGMEKVHVQFQRVEAVILQYVQ